MVYRDDVLEKIRNLKKQQDRKIRFVEMSQFTDEELQQLSYSDFTESFDLSIRENFRRGYPYVRDRVVDSLNPRLENGGLYFALEAFRLRDVEYLRKVDSLDLRHHFPKVLAEHPQYIMSIDNECSYIYSRSEPLCREWIKTLSYPETREKVGNSIGTNEFSYSANYLAQYLNPTIKLPIIGRANPQDEYVRIIGYERYEDVLENLRDSLKVEGNHLEYIDLGEKNRKRRNIRDRKILSTFDATLIGYDAFALEAYRKNPEMRQYIDQELLDSPEFLEQMSKIDVERDLR